MTTHIASYTAASWLYNYVASYCSSRIESNHGLKSQKELNMQTHSTHKEITKSLKVFMCIYNLKCVSQL